MDADSVLQLGQNALKIMGLVSAPILITALLVGLLVSIFQALTQINEATLTFIPKMVAIALVLTLAGPWMLDTMKEYTTQVFEDIATVVRE